MTATDDLFFAEEIDSGYECFVGHPLRLVAEGYALCTGDCMWWAWRMTPPSSPRWYGRGVYWGVYPTRRGGVSDGCRWISPPFHSRERALDYIRRDIEAHRNLPIDEEAERQRLMPV